ncbi:MAG: ABC transporter permease [Sphingomonadaceae bacterium]|nr:ABC transporter permease [Sphingomonadaceae bacterium]
MSTATTRSRLSIWQAAFVIARRDFVAILFSRAFIFFLLGPLFPVMVGALAGGIGSEVQQQASSSAIGVAMGEADNAAMLAAHERLADQLGPVMPDMVAVPDASADFDARALLEERKGDYAAIVTGTPAAPVVTGTEQQVERLSGRVALVAAGAASTAPQAFPPVKAQIVASSGASEKADRVRTAQAGQLLLFLLIMLLAGMVLSNLVEEKGNKIIEILAAAIPMDAVFLGKLFAMLAVSFVGILVWGSAGALAFASGAVGMGALTEPAVGWPLFFALGVIYFAMGYLLLGSLFLTIGAMASTVREVQTLSMPVTMLQLLVFFFASYALAKPGSWQELAASVFPLSSPFAMLARAATEPAVWPHMLALAWQVLFVALLVKGGATLFRRRVMQSGPQGAKKRGWFRKRTAAALAGSAV